MTQDEIIEMAIQAGIAEEIAAFNIPIVEAFAKLVAAKAIKELESQERNFCPRCGKRLGGIDSIHTCTPPQRTWVGLKDEEVFEICNSSYNRDSELVKMVEAVLKEKNGYAQERNT